MPINLYATAAFTSIGLSSRETASSVRSQLSGNDAEDGYWLDSRERRVKAELVPEEALYSLSDALLTERIGSNRTKWLLQLAGTALRNDIPPLKPKPPLCLALPEQEGGSPINPEKFITWLSLQTNGEFFDPAASSAEFKGRAGVLLALVKAAGLVAQTPSALVLVGGVDTFDDPVLLHRLEREERLLTDENSDGFTPGEGAGFLLVGGGEAAKKHGLAPIAQIAIPAVGFEPGHMYGEEIYRADGLLKTMQDFFAKNPPSSPVGEIYSTMNGEYFWARELGAVLSSQGGHLGPARLHHPAENIGDIGAAFGAVLISLAATGIAQGYRKSPALVYASSDYGNRAVTTVRKPE
jgi:3-oxoacyl-[acyl-carrier-protein] synthase-1